jgi:uroporphyrinogen-III synthase
VSPTSCAAAGLQKYFCRLANKALAGRGIVVTRPHEQAAGLAALVEAAGARALLYPAIEIQSLPDPSAALRLIERLDKFDLAIFVSPSAVQQGFALIRRHGRWPAGLRAASVGRGSRDELERHGISGALAPESGADSEALLALPELASVAGLRIVIFRGEGGREVLGDTLLARGAQVEYADCYRRVRPRIALAPLLAAWRAREVDAITVSSSTGLANFVALLGEPGRGLLEDVPVFVPHARVEEQALRLGVRRPVLAGPSDAEMIARLVAYFSDP